MQSLEALKSSTAETSEGRLHLEAQLHYRLGHYEAAIQNYEDLFQHFGVCHSRTVYSSNNLMPGSTDNRHDDGCLQVTAVDARTNIVAAYTAGGRSREVSSVMDAMKITAKDGFEVAFNLACSRLLCGQPEEARELLLLALRSGEALGGAHVPHAGRSIGFDGVAHARRQRNLAGGGVHSGAC